MVRSMSLRLCSRAPLITISVCCRISLPPCGGGPGWAVCLATDPCSHPTGLRLAPRARLCGGGRRHRVAVLHRIATQSHEPVAQLSGALELQVAGRFLHLALE